MFSRMLSYIKSWFKKDELYEDFNELDLYTEDERLIFSFFDGQKVRKVDPLPLFRRYLDISTDLEADFQAFESPIPNKFAPQAYLNAIGRLRKMFEVEPFDKGGLTEIELRRTFDEFMIFCQIIKKKSKEFQTSQEGTSPGMPSLNQEKENSQGTSSSLDTGSTGKDSNTEMHLPSISEPVQPLAK